MWDPQARWMVYLSLFHGKPFENMDELGVPPTLGNLHRKRSQEFRRKNDLPFLQVPWMCAAYVKGTTDHGHILSARA